MVSASKSLEERNRVLEAENRLLHDTIRKQGEFIVGLKHSIRDFVGNA